VTVERLIELLLGPLELPARLGMLLVPPGGTVIGLLDRLDLGTRSTWAWMAGGCGSNVPALLAATERSASTAWRSR
jgi:hypothetical protein